MPIFYLVLLPGVLAIKPLTLADTLLLLAVIFLVEAILVAGHILVAQKANGLFNGGNASVPLIVEPKPHDSG